MRTIASNLWNDEEGQDLTEYALMVAVVALAAIASMGSLATAISQSFFFSSGKYQCDLMQ